MLLELGWATRAEPKIAKRSCSHCLGAPSGWTLLMSQLIDGIAGSATACILFLKWQHKSNHSFRNTCLLAPKIDLNMKINHSAKLEGHWARTCMYRAEIMDMWLSVVMCDQTNTVVFRLTVQPLWHVTALNRWEGCSKSRLPCDIATKLFGQRQLLDGGQRVPHRNVLYSGKWWHNHQDEEVDENLWWYIVCNR